jgi:PAS domain S-box-containing protein
MGFRLNSLGLKLNLALLLFFLVVGFATAGIVYFGFDRTRENANERSREALEELGRQNLQEIANSQSALGALQLEWAAEIGHRSGRFMQEFKASGGVAAHDVSRLTRTPNGLWIDPDPKRASDMVILPRDTLDAAVLDDIAYSAALEPLFPSLMSGFPGEIADESFHPTAIIYVGVSGMGRYYPPRGTVYQTTPADMDLAAVFDETNPQQNPERKTIWSPPYQDLAGQGLVITAITPVYEGDTFRGLFEVDLLIGNLVETVNLVKPTENGFAFYVDTIGKILRTDAYDLLANELESRNNEVLGALIGRMQSGERGVERVRMGGQDYFVAFAPIDRVGGGFAAVAPVAELTDEAAAITAGIDEQADQTMTVVLTAMAVLFAMAIVGATYLNRRVLLRPIEALVAGTRAVAAGDFETSIPVRGDDELSTLGHSFNQMTAEILQRAESLRQEVREREAAQEELRALFAAMTDLVFTVDRDGRFLGVADTNSPMKHTLPHGSVGQTLFDVMPRELVEPILEAIRAALNERRTLTVEFSREAGGRTEWHSAAISPLSDTAIVAVVRDITERVVARQQLELQRDALQQEVIERQAAQEELRALFAAMTDAVVVINRDGLYLRVPPTNAPAILIPPEDLPGKNMRDVMPAGQADEFMEVVEEALSRHETTTVEYPLLIDEKTYWFSAAVSPISDEEVLVVARDITDRMNARQELERQVRERTQELQTLLNVSRNVASTLELRPLLDMIIQQLEQIIEFNRCSIFELDGETMVILDSRATFTEMPLDMRFSVAELGPIWERMSRGEGVVVDDVHDDTAFAKAYRAAAGPRMETDAFQVIHSALGVPLIAKDRIIGMLVLSHMQRGHFTEDHAALVQAVATQIAIAIENARLYAQAQQLAAVEERQRLARELHDSVSQALYGIALGARTARTLLDRDPSKAAEPVDYVLSLAEAGLAEMRALIFELRPESLEIEGLVAALDKQIDATAARYGIEVTSDLPEEPEMSLAQKEIFYRIGQEALHNVVKHAHASRATVRLARDNGSFVLEVGDNGVGFDAGQSFPGHMGLVSMSERASSIGAQLEVESAPGKGTLIKLRAAADQGPGGLD